jgi:agmatine deiminase
MAEIIAAISRYQEIRINIAPELENELFQFVNEFDHKIENIIPYPHSTDDVWCRDHGPIFIKHKDTGNLAITNWGFNAWGGKFPPWDQDNQIPEKIASCLDLPIFTAPMILEGGSIEVNGQGDLITTESVLLNPNRNPNLTKEEIEKNIRDYLGINRILWLKEGIEGDDTDGHIDDLVRFVNKNTLVIASETAPDDINYPALTQLREDLDREIQKYGLDWTIHSLPMPGPCTAENWRLERLPASYANFIILNNAVLVPIFNQPDKDQEALNILTPLFPNHTLIPIDCNTTVYEGGAIHCLTQQQPKHG